MEAKCLKVKVEFEMLTTICCFMTTCKVILHYNLKCCCVSVASTKDGVPAGSDANERNPGYNISAALTYTAQLVNVLAFYLDVRLPCKLYYR